MRNARPALALALAAACGGTWSPPVAPAPPASAAVPVAPTVSQPQAQPGVEPTVLTEAQRARDLALAPRAAAIVDAYANTNGPFSTLVANLTSDGKQVLFGSMRAGVQQIYLGDVGKPEAPPRALTSGRERAMWAAFTRDEKHVLFTRDEGADENWRVYRVELDGSGTTCLPPGPSLHRDEPLLPKGKPGTMVYTQHEPRSAASQLVVQSLSGGEPRVVYDDPAPASFTAARRTAPRSAGTRSRASSRASATRSWSRTSAAPPASAAPTRWPTTATSAAMSSGTWRPSTRG